jgi:elongation factor G
MEPIMQLNVNVPEAYVGSVVADIGRRRGMIREMLVRGHYRHMEGEVPLAEVRGYATDLRNLTQGRGIFTLKFDRYDVVPDDIAERIIEAAKERDRVPA